MKKTVLQVIAFCFLLIVDNVIAAGITFPGAKLETPSPMSKYSVRYNTIDAEGPYGPHGLFLVDSATGESKLVLGFERSADVLWSPDGQFLAVTNWFGSNVSEVFVFQLTSLEKVEIRSVLKKAIGIFPWERAIENLSEYFEALSWETSSTLKVRVNGHGLREGNGVENFEKYYLYDASTSAIKALDK